jgi:hypothetical protein
MSLTFRRYEDKLNNIDLNLSYITPRIIVVSSENDMATFANFLMIKHASRYKVFNLSMENDLCEVLDDRLVDSTSMMDDLPCPLLQLEQLMFRIDNFLLISPSNVAIFYCETGLKKCALVVSCLLLYLGIYLTAQEAVAYFVSQRVETSIEAKEIISSNFLRYIHYYECTLRVSEVVSFAYSLDCIRFVKVPNMSTSVTVGGVIPSINVDEILNREEEVILRPVFRQIAQTGTSGVRFFSSNDEYAVMDLRKYQIKVFGDVVLSLYSDDFPMFEICFNTAFIESNFISFEKDVIDEARKDVQCVTFHRDFKFEIYLHRVKTKTGAS